MVAFKSSRLSALLVAFALVLTFFGALQLSTTGTASATALACPAPTTNVNDKGQRAAGQPPGESGQDGC